MGKSVACDDQSTGVKLLITAAVVGGVVGAVLDVFSTPHIEFISVIAFLLVGAMAAATVFGLIYGSIKSMEQINSPAWYDKPHEPDVK